MGIKVRGLQLVKQNLVRGVERSTRAARRALREGAYAVRDEARALAPYKKGFVESAIKVDDESRELNTTTGGYRKTYAVYIDGNVKGDGGRPVSRYAVWLHESSYNLGKRSQAKADATGKDVGPKFMERAAWVHKPIIFKKLLDAVRRELR